MTRDYLTVKVWDLNMENRPIETYQVQNTPFDGFYISLRLQMVAVQRDRRLFIVMCYIKYYRLQVP